MKSAAYLAVQVTATGIQKTRAQLMAVQGSLNATGGAGQRMGSQIAKGAKVASVGVGVGLGFAVKKAADFEQQLDNLGSVSNATGRQMEQFRRQAMKAGADTKFSALEAAEAQTELAKGGLSVRNIMGGGLKSALALAAAGELDLAAAASTTANAMNLFALKGRDSMKVADMLAQAANATTADVSDFAVALTQGGSVARSAGLSIRETVLALEALAKLGIKNSDAGTSLKTALIQLIKPTAKQAELADKLNLSFVDQQGKIKSLAAISKMLRGELGDQTQAQRTATLATLAGTDGVRTLTALYDAGPAKLNRWEVGLSKSGTAAQVAARKQDNLKGKLENLQGSVETIAISVGSKLLPTLTDAAEKITDVLSDPKLTAREKFDRFAGMISKAVEAGLSKATDLAATYGPKIAAALATGLVTWWSDANLLMKILGAAAIVRLLGGPGALKATGAVIGRWLGGGIAIGAATGAAGGAVGGAAAGGLLGALRSKLLPFAKRVGLAGVGIALADSVISEFGRRAQERSPNLFKALEAKQGNMFADPGSPLSLFGKFTKESEHAARRLLPALQEIADKAKAISPARAKELRQELGRIDGVTGEARAAFDRLVGSAEDRFWAVRRAVNSVTRSVGLLRDGLVFNVKDMRHETEANLSRIASVIGANTARGRELIAANFQAGLVSIKRFVKDGKLTVGEGMKEISRLMRIHSRAGVSGMGGNLDGLRRHIARTMRRGGEITREGMALIKELFVKELRLYGLSPQQALAGANVRTGEVRGGFRRQDQLQRGGYINTGKLSGDSVPALLERDEYVLNRRATRAIGKHTLDAINFGAAPRFQGGGWVGDSPAGLNPAIKSIAMFAMRKYGASASDTLRAPGTLTNSGNVSNHSLGAAVDLVSPDMLSMALGLDRNFRPRLDELIHTPMGYGVKHGQKVPPYAAADHYDHVHVAAMGRAVRALARLARVDIKGNGPIRDIVQRAVDRTRKAAQNRLDDLSMTGFQRGGVVGGGGLAGLNKTFPAHYLGQPGAQLSSNQVRAVAEKWGGLSPARALQADQITLGESSRHPGIIGRDPGGTLGIGLWQITRGVQGALGKRWIDSRGGDTGMRNPRKNAEVMGLMSSHGTDWGAWFGTRFLRPLQRNVQSVLEAGGTGKPPEDRLTAKQRRRLRRPFGGPLGTVLTKTLKVLRSSGSAKVRGTRLRQLERKIKAGGLPRGLNTQVGVLRKGVEVSGQYADLASRLNVDNEDGTTTLGVFRGRDEAGWLTDQLAALFRLRNKLVEAQRVVARRRDLIAGLVERARKRLAAVADQVRAAGKKRRGLDKQLGRLKRKPKVNAAAIKATKAAIGEIDSKQKVRVRERKLLSGRILPALTGRRDVLGTLRGELVGSDGLEGVQGAGGPMGHLRALPPLGVLGGSIFDVQLRLRDLAAPAAVRDNEPVAGGESVELLRQLLREANLRTGVSEAQFRTLRDFRIPGVPYLGAFAQGGLALVGEGGPELAHMPSGTRVHSAADTQTLLRPNVNVSVTLFEGEDRAVVTVNDRQVEAAVERVTRRDARHAARRLPSGGGGRG